MKGYRLVLLSMALTSVINGLLYSVLALYVYSASEDFFLVGLMMALPFLAAVPMTFVWGAVSDRIGSRKMVIAGAGLAGGVLFFPMPFLGTTWLIALRFVQVALTTSIVLLNATVTEFFPAKKGSSVGDLALVGGAGQMAGALAAGFLLPYGEMHQGSAALMSVFFLSGVLVIVASLAVLPIEEAGKKAVGVRARDLLKFGERKGMVPVVLAALVIPLSGYIVFSVFPVYIGNLDIPWDATMKVGVFTALSAVTGIFASGFAGRACDRWGRRWVLVGSGIAYVLVWLGMGFTRDPFVTAFFWAMPVWSFFYVSSTAMVSDLTREDERGRGIGLVNSAMNLGGAVGAITAGYLLSKGVVDNVFFAAAFVAAIGTCAAFACRETLARD
ncbi:MAG: MFS transporter [Methanobacteriota archaeon]